MFNQEIQTAYIYNAHKPSIKNYEKAMKIMGTTKERTLFVGDQLFTDVWGAKENRDSQYFSEADPSKRGDSDRFEALFGENCSSFL